ncbi:MAG: ABC transporter permease [Dysgonamonadaceae bacterium]|jgi:ABC-type antimicrobial peptide transport system permease subunit|nr:ABC transporter permease [Dysgonamonadaceae bacterium]
MFYNLKIAIRNLRRNGLYSIINIIGLTVSLTACILITLWVYDEWSYDRFHKNKENIYLVKFTDNKDYFDTPAGLSVNAKAEIPEIKETCRIDNYSSSFFIYNDRYIFNNTGITHGAAVDSSFFRMFSFPLIDGNPQKPFESDFSIILSESMAKSIFGDENPMGKAIKAGFSANRFGNTVIPSGWYDEYYYVTGIMKDMPENSSIQYDYLIPFSLLSRNYAGRNNEARGPFNSWDEDYGTCDFDTYLEFYPGSNIKQAEEKVTNIFIKRIMPYLNAMGAVDQLPQVKFFLQPVTALHLYNADGSSGEIVKVRMFAIIAGLILAIACINYVNLVTARTGKRSKEMGIRKFLGAKWINIVLQSLQETCVILFVSIVLATVLIYLLLPAYNQISGKNMEFHLLSFNVLIIYGIALLSVLGLAGIYPSIYLASFNPAKATKSKNLHSSFRKGLVVLQFICSIVLIVSTIVITLQMNFIRKKDLGYEKENIICVSAWGMKGRQDMVRSELQKNPNITGVTTANFDNMLCQRYSYSVRWQGQEKAINFGIGFVNFDFFDVMNVQLVEGQVPHETPGEQYCLLNETAIRAMELKDPLNQTIKLDDQLHVVTGVVKDFHFEKLNQSITPLVLFCTKDYESNFFYIRTTAQGTKSALASIEKLWKEYHPNRPFSYSFLDENFEHLYKADIRLGLLLYIFAFIAIMISCLGLFGLVTYTAETKTKEIGIRKVLGASVSNIVNMLSKEFLILIGVAMLIAFPLAYYWLDKMLQDYAYHISIGWWMFALAGAITILLTLVTVGWRAVKAATVNPVESIKTE